MSDRADDLAQFPASEGTGRPVTTHEAIDFCQPLASTAWRGRLALQRMIARPNNAHRLTGDVQLRRDLRWRQSGLYSVKYSSDQLAGGHSPFF